MITPVVRFCLPQDLPASVFSTRARGRLEPARARAMGLRASDPAGHHGWGGRWMRCGRRPGFRGDPPISGPTGAGPVSGGVHSTGAAVSPPTGVGPQNLRRNALSGLQNGRRGPSRRSSGERDRDCRKPGEIADLTLSSGRGPGRVSPQVSIASWKCAKNQVVVQRKCAESSWR